MVVKVQLSLATTESRRQVLVQASTGHWFEGDADDDTIKAMGDDVKAYFRAHLEHGYVVLDGRTTEAEYEGGPL